MSTGAAILGSLLELIDNDLVVLTVGQQFRLDTGAGDGRCANSRSVFVLQQQDLVDVEGLTDRYGLMRYPNNIAFSGAKLKPDN
ncbi:MAG: hypothetical protein NTW07_09285 [candidate division Zixibacteria bacterium]|nr:hypothetical protein [candidate division Zixibacteria bacterium]